MSIVQEVYGLFGKFLPVFILNEVNFAFSVSRDACSDGTSFWSWSLLVRCLPCLDQISHLFYLFSLGNHVLHMVDIHAHVPRLNPNIELD